MSRTFVLAARAILFVALMLRSPTQSEEPARRLSALDVSTLNLARDQGGRTLTFSARERVLQTWSARGQLEKTCQFDSTQTYAAGYVGLNGVRVLFAAAAGDHSTLDVYDSFACRALKSAQLEGAAVLAVSASRDGWLVRARQLSTNQDMVIAIDTDARTTAKFDLQPGTDDSGGATDATYGSISQAIEVNNDVWLVPGAVYALVRPPQHGNPEYIFEPPACIAAKGRKLSDSDAESYRKRMVSQFSGTTLGAITAKPPSSFSVHLAPLAGVASYRSFVGVMVRSPEGPSCRLDIWDLVSEKLVYVKPFAGCPSRFWFTDESIEVVGDSHILGSAVSRVLVRSKRTGTL